MVRRYGVFGLGFCPAWWPNVRFLAFSVNRRVCCCSHPLLTDSFTDSPRSDAPLSRHPFYCLMLVSVSSHRLFPHRSPAFFLYSTLHIPSLSSLKCPSLSTLHVSCVSPLPFLQAELERMAECMECRVDKDFSDEVTHVVTKARASNHNLLSGRPVKYLLGVLRGKWVVTMDCEYNTVLAATHYCPRSLSSLNDGGAIPKCVSLPACAAMMLCFWTCSLLWLFLSLLFSASCDTACRNAAGTPSHCTLLPWFSPSGVHDSLLNGRLMPETQYEIKGDKVLQALIESLADNICCHLCLCPRLSHVCASLYRRYVQLTHSTVLFTGGQRRRHQVSATKRSKHSTHAHRLSPLFHHSG